MFELYAFTVDMINMVPNTQTGNYTTPFQLMTRKRPVIGAHKFGQVGYMYMKRPELGDARAEFGIYCGYDLNNPNNMRIYSVQRDTMYMRNKFMPQPYVPNELNLKRRVETTLPSDEVVDMVKEQPYWKGNMVRPSTWHTPSALALHPDPILGSFDARRAHNPLHDARGFGGQGSGNHSMDTNVKEHASQVESPPTFAFADPPIPDTLTPSATPVQSETPCVETDLGIRDVPTVSRLPAQKAAKQPIQVEGAYRGLRSRGKAGLVEGLVAINKVEDKSVDQLLAGTFENVREGVAYPETDARKEVTPSPFIQAYRTSVTKALKQPDGPRKDAVIKAIRDEVQQIIDVGAIAPARFESLTEKERKKVIPSHLFVTPKYDAQGNFVREKGRWVASGNFLDTMGMDVQRSPTVNQSSVMILLSIAATARYDILTGDIKGAYLYTSIKEDEPQIYMWVDKVVADILCEVSPE